MRVVEGVIEIPIHCPYKYEVDEINKVLVLDRPLKVPSAGNYGYVPETLAEDGDPLDIFVLGSAPLQPMAHVKLHVHGVLKCVDNGEQDDKLLCTLVGQEISGSGAAEVQIHKISEYLKVYKPGFVYVSREDASVAEQVLDQSIGRYNAKVKEIEEAFKPRR